LQFLPEVGVMDPDRGRADAPGRPERTLFCLTITSSPQYEALPLYPEGSMKGTIKLFAAAVAVGVLATIALGPSTASAAAEKCRGKKIKAIGKKESRLLSCSAKEATHGTVGVEPDCNNKAISKFQTSYDKPGACTDPPSSVCELIADDCRDKVRMALPDGDGTNPSVCESKRLKAAGKKASRKLKCYAKAAAKDLPVDTSCLGKATTKFTADFNKLTGCTGDGNVAGIETLIDNECVNQLVTVDGMGHVTAICPAGGATTTTTTMGGSTTTSTSVSTTTTTTLACSLPQMCHDVCTAGAAECTSCTTADGAGTSGTPGVTCVQAVCSADPTCCDPDFGWTSLCVSEVDTDCCPSGGTCCGT